jgi:hypothetical protein
MTTLIEKRNSGIPLIGNVSWGTHFCQFYQTKIDLLEILVPYFKAGLENNEYCMWVTAENLGVDEASEALKKAVPDLDDYFKKGQIEIFPYTEWYIRNGRFNAKKVLAGWVERHDSALKKGFYGLRLTGNTFWIEKHDWQAFAEYESAVHGVIGGYKMIGLCAYSLEKCGVPEILDVVKNHEFALVLNKGTWQTVSMPSSVRHN